MNYEEVNDLVQRAKHHDERAYERLIEAAKPMLRSEAGHFMRASPRLEYDDAYSIATLAVVEAVTEFDSAKGVWYPFLQMKVRQKLSHEVARQTAKRRNINMEEPLSHDVPCDEPDLSDTVMRDDVIARCRELAREMLDEQTYEIYQRYMQGQKPQAIRQELGLPDKMRIDSLISRVNKRITDRVRRELGLND